MKIRKAVLAVLLATCVVFAAGCGSSLYSSVLHEISDAVASDAGQRVTEDLGRAGSRSLTLDAEECSVRLLETTADTGVIRAEYNPDYYTAELDGSTIRCRSVMGRKPDRRTHGLIDVYVPAGAKSWTLRVEDCFFLWDSVPRAEVTGTASGSMSVLQFPDEYDGSFSIDFPDGFTVLSSADDFSRTSVRITADAVAAPDGFFVEAAFWEHAADGPGNIEVDAKHGLVIVGDADGASIEKGAGRFSEHIRDAAQEFAEHIRDAAQEFAGHVRDDVQRSSHASEEHRGRPHRGDD